MFARYKLTKTASLVLLTIVLLMPPLVKAATKTATKAATSKSSGKTLQKGPCAMGYVQQALSVEEQKAMPGYHKCMPTTENRLNLQMTASQGAVSAGSMPRYFFKTIYLAPGVRAAPQSLMKLGKLSIFYYQTLKGKLATIQAYCKSLGHGDNNNFLQYDVNFNGQDVTLKNLKKTRNPKDNGSGCYLDLHSLPYINYKNAITHFATINYVYDIPDQCPAGRVLGKHHCRCPKGLLLDNGNCVSPKYNHNLKLSFNFKPDMKYLKYTPYFRVSMKLIAAQRGVTIQQNNLDGNGDLLIDFTKDSLGALANVDARCIAGKDETGRRVYFSVNFDGSKVYFVPRLNIDLEPSGKECDLYLYRNKLPQQAYYKNGEYRVHFKFVYGLGNDILKQLGMKRDKIFIPITLGYRVSMPKILKKNQVCLPGNTYINYLKEIAPSRGSDAFQSIQTADLRKPTRYALMKTWRWNFMYNPNHPERVIGQSIVIRGGQTCNNRYCGASFCVNSFKIKYVVRHVNPLILQCVPGQYRDVCDDNNVCKGIRCTPWVSSQGEPVRIQCVELGPYNCREQ